MVLPASASDLASGTAGKGWFDRIIRILRLKRRGLLVLVDDADDTALGGLVRALLPDFPGVEVYTDADKLVLAPPGSVVVLKLDASHAPFLNVQRPTLGQRELKVILWSRKTSSAALARSAPDFFDWISHRIECPQMVPEYAVVGLRCAVLARSPGIVWRGKQLQEAFRLALPGRPWRTASGDANYTTLLREARTAGRSWLIWTGVNRPMRVRWALAESGRRGRTLFDNPAADSPGWWLITDAVADLKSAESRLGMAGAESPGRLAAVALLEPDAVELLDKLLRNGVRQGVLLDVMLRSNDPGAELGSLAMELGLISLESVAMGKAPMPVLRRFARVPESRELRRRIVEHTDHLINDERDEYDAENGQAFNLDDLARWACYARGDLKLFSESFPGIAQGYFLEAVLRRRSLSAHEWKVLSRIVRTLGEPLVAEHFNVTARNMALGLALRSTDFRASGGLLDDAADSFLERARARSERRGTASPGWPGAKVLRKFGSDFEAQESPDEAQESPDEVQEFLDEVQASPDEAQASPDEAQASPDEAQASPDEEVLLKLPQFTDMSALESRAAPAPENIEDVVDFAEELLAENHVREAERVVEYGLALMPFLEESHGEHASYIPLLRLSGKILTRRGHFGQAVRVLTEVFRLHAAAIGLDNPGLVPTLVAYATALAAQGRSVDAESIVQQALQLTRFALPSLAKERAVLLRQLASLEAALGRKSARHTANRALKAIGDVFGEEDPIYAEGAPVLIRILQTGK